MGLVPCWVCHVLSMYHGLLFPPLSTFVVCVCVCVFRRDCTAHQVYRVVHEGVIKAAKV